jgi:hypothetical protein
MSAAPPGWEWLLSHAALAPSPHNVQPWRIRIQSEHEAELWIERARTLPDEDVTGSFIVMTMGLFVETLRLAAAHRGLTVEDHPVHEFSWYAADHLRTMREPLIPFARLRLREAPDAAPEYDLSLLEQRRTSRLHYTAEPVPAAAVTSLADVAALWGHRFVCLTDVARIERILRLNIHAVFSDLNLHAYRDELGSWIRYSRQASERARDGLDARCMNVSPVELWLMFHAPWLLRSPLRPWFARRYRRQIGPVSTLGMLSGQFWSPADAYAAGRLLIRFWLECTRLGLYLHPYGNLVTHRSTAEKVRSETAVDDIWLVFKLGRSAAPPRSHRRALEEILIA